MKFLKDLCNCLEKHKKLEAKCIPVACSNAHAEEIKEVQITPRDYATLIQSTFDGWYPPPIVKGLTGIKYAGIKIFIKTK